MDNIQKHLSLLGLRVTDRVTGFEGVVASVCFDLYGCIQAVVNPGLTPEGKLGASEWFDVSRLEPANDTPVMPRPDYIEGALAEGKHGPAEKPLRVKG